MLGHLRCPHRFGTQSAGDPNHAGLAARDHLGNPQTALDTDIQTTKSVCLS